MKNNLAFLFVVSACAAYAASTCETRVDSHQDATTRERVAYCLSQEPVEVEEETAGPQLVYSGAYSVKQKEQTPVKSDVKNGYFKGDQLSVRREYVGSEQFPAFTNETPAGLARAQESESYDLEEETYADSEPEQKYADNEPQEQTLDPEEVKRVLSQRAPARLDEPSAEAAVSVSAFEQRGLQARQQKPKRFMKQAAYDYEEPANTPLPPAATEYMPQPQTSYDDATAPGQAEFTQDVQNDDDLLNDELGLESEFAPIPASGGQN